MPKNSMLRKLKTIKRLKKIVPQETIDEIKESKEELEYAIVNGQFLLEGEKALWLAEACKENKKEKAAKKRLGELKKQLSLKDKGEYVNKAGDKVVVSVSGKKSEIEPHRLYKLMVKNKMVSRFWGCVKVQLGPLKKVVPETSINKMQINLDPIVKSSFK